MEHELKQTVALLTRTPAALDALLRDLPEAWTKRSEGEGTWTVVDVIGHMVHCERSDWMPRTRMILESGEKQPFTPLDREAYLHEAQKLPLSRLLDDFAQLRSKNLAQLQAFNLSPLDLAKRGLHPSFGPVTLSQLLATWATHDLTHLHQVSRIMAHQYRDAVGPWQKYLGVLHCDGHSSS